VLTGERHHLYRQHRRWLIAAKNHRVTWFDIRRAMLFNHSEHIASQEKTPAQRYGVPADRIQKVDTIGEDESKSGGTMTFVVARAQVG